MATIGDGSRPNGGWRAYQGSSQINQVAEQLAMPRNGTIHTVGCWIGGWNGACDVWLSVWSSAGARPLLAQSQLLTVANEGAGGPAGSNVALYVADLVTPLDLATGDGFLVGFVRKQGDGHQISYASGPAHYDGRSGSTVQAASFAQGGSYGTDTGRIGAYVANYVERPGAWQYRSGAWQQSEAVSAGRGGAPALVDSVSVYRSGAWVEAD